MTTLKQLIKLWIFSASMILWLLLPAFNHLVWAAAPGDSNSTAPAPLDSSEILSFLSGMCRCNNMLGDRWGGLRPVLGGYGVSLSLLETSEMLGNVSGGVRQGFEYDGSTYGVLQIDTKKAFGLYGGTFNASALQIHGRNLSTDNLLVLQSASGIEAWRSTRLWELWYQQQFDKADTYDVKIGQQSLDNEFMVSQNALLFVNAMFGWPMLPAADLPAGGAAYPLASLGIRLRTHIPATSWTFLAGVFSGSPVKNNSGDPLDSSGTSFALNTGALAIAEVQYAYPSSGAGQNGEGQLPRVYKLGFWYDTEGFADQRFDDTGLSLSKPESTEIPRAHGGDYAIYAVLDQTIWQQVSEPGRTLNVFVRAMGTPLADRNPVDFSMNAGITFKEPFLHRCCDSFGLGVGYAHVSSQAAAFDRDTIPNNSALPVRSGETVVEATYQYQITPWWQAQPDFQYFFNPGGGIPNPDSSSGERVKNEAVIGLRTTITF